MRMESRVTACIRRELRVVSSRFSNVSTRLKQAHPGIRLVHQAQRLDDIEQRLAGAVGVDRRGSRDSLRRQPPDCLQRSHRPRGD